MLSGWRCGRRESCAGGGGAALHAAKWKRRRHTEAIKTRQAQSALANDASTTMAAIRVSELNGPGPVSHAPVSRAPHDYPSRLSESTIRVDYPSRLSESYASPCHRPGRQFRPRICHGPGYPGPAAPLSSPGLRRPPPQPTRGHIHTRPSAGTHTPTQHPRCIDPPPDRGARQRASDESRCVRESRLAHDGSQVQTTRVSGPGRCTEHVSD